MATPLTKDERVRGELDAMRTILYALRPLNGSERLRVMSWVNSTLNDKADPPEGELRKMILPPAETVEW